MINILDMINYLSMKNHPQIDPPEEFKNLKKNAEKIRYCQNNKPKVWKPKSHLVKNKKNDDISLKARKEGNIKFKELNYVEALHMYNKSLSYATTGSENISICYANRSAVYFNAGLYKMCLENIESALNHGYPELLKHKLEKRQEKCLEKMRLTGQKQNEVTTAVKLSYPAKDKNPFMIEGLELANSDQFGRHIRTKHDLYPGDIVMIDQPYAKKLNEDYQYMMCNNCLLPNCLNLFSCEKCANAMYCSKKCETDAWTRFHKFECEVIPDHVNLIALRLTLHAFTLYDDCSKLKDLFESAKAEPVTAFDFDYKNLREEDTLKAICCLEAHSDKRSDQETFMRCHLLAKTWNNLYRKTKIKEILKTRELEDLFLEKLFTFSQITHTNAYDLGYKLRQMKEFDENEAIGAAISPAFSLFNHSCDPNVIRSSFNGSFYIMVLKNIKAGEQLFDNYGRDYINNPKLERQLVLKEVYVFDCLCNACENDYPSMDSLTFTNLFGFTILYRAYLSLLEQTTRKNALKCLKMTKNFIKKYHEETLSGELYFAKKILDKCTETLHGNIPLELQLKPREN